MDYTTQTARTTVVRSRDRGRYERNTINAIIDEALICHVGFSVDGADRRQRPQSDID